MIAASIVLGVIGVAITRYATTRMAPGDAGYPADAYWLLGLIAMLPAWLVLFIGLLGRMGGRTPRMSVAAWWVLSSAAALLGAIITHGRLRRAVESGDEHPPRTFWRLGIIAVVPAWCLALLGVLMAGTALRPLR